MPDAATIPSPKLDAAPFPLGLCVGAVLVSSLGLTAAAWGIRWRVAPPPGDALPAAWGYVHVAMTFIWLVFWPAAALRPGRLGGLQRLLWDWLALAIACIPALGIAAFVTGIPWRQAVAMCAMQAAFGQFAYGALSIALTRRSPLVGALTTGILAALATLLPLFQFIWSEFLPTAWNGWTSIIPVTALLNATPASAWSTTAGYGITGILLIVFARLSARRRQTPAN